MKSMRYKITISAFTLGLLGIGGQAVADDATELAFPPNCQMMNQTRLMAIEARKYDLATKIAKQMDDLGC